MGRGLSWEGPIGSCLVTETKAEALNVGLGFCHHHKMPRRPVGLRRTSRVWSRGSQPHQRPSNEVIHDHCFMPLSCGVIDTQSLDEKTEVQRALFKNKNSSWKCS